MWLKCFEFSFLRQRLCSCMLFWWAEFLLLCSRILTPICCFCSQALGAPAPVPPPEAWLWWVVWIPKLPFWALWQQRTPQHPRVQGLGDDWQVTQLLAWEWDFLGSPCWHYRTGWALRLLPSHSVLGFHDSVVNKGPSTKANLEVACGRCRDVELPSQSCLLIPGTLKASCEDFTALLEAAPILYWKTSLFLLFLFGITFCVFA